MRTMESDGQLSAKNERTMEHGWQFPAKPMRSMGGTGSSHKNMRTMKQGWPFTAKCATTIRSDEQLSAKHLRIIKKCANYEQGYQLSAKSMRTMASDGQFSAKIVNASEHEAVLSKIHENYGKLRAVLNNICEH